MVIIRIISLVLLTFDILTFYYYLLSVLCVSLKHKNIFNNLCIYGQHINQLN